MSAYLLRKLLRVEILAFILVIVALQMLTYGVSSSLRGTDTSYSLGLVVGKDGAFSLLVFDSRQAMKNGLFAFTSALYRGEFKADIVAPMTFAR